MTGRDDDLNAVIGILHKEVERGYVTPGQIIALADLISAARDEGREDGRADVVGGYVP